MNTLLLLVSCLPLRDDYQARHSPIAFQLRAAIPMRYDKRENVGEAQFCVTDFFPFGSSRQMISFSLIPACREKGKEGREITL